MIDGASFGSGTDIPVTRIDEQLKYTTVQSIIKVRKG
jgi:hypothetical protein